MKSVPQRAIYAVVLVAASILASDAAADVCVYKPPKVRLICGVIVDRFGAPLHGANVTIVKDGTAVKAAITDEAGEFDFNVMQPGKYELDATIAGFQHARYQLTLSNPTNSCKHTLQVRMAVGSIYLRRRRNTRNEAPTQSQAVTVVKSPSRNLTNRGAGIVELACNSS